MHRPLRERDLDALLPEPVEDALPELVLRKVLVGEFPDLADEGEVQGTLAEPGDEADERLGVRQESLDGGRSLFRFLDQDALHLRRVRGIAYAHGNLERHLLLRQVVIGDHALGKLVVGDDVHVVRQHPDPRGPPRDVIDVPLLPGFQLDEITHANRFFHEDVDAREQVGQSVLESQGYGQAADAQGCDKRGDRNAEIGQNDQETDDEDRALQDAVREARRRDRDVGLLDIILEQAARDRRRSEGYGQNNDHVEYLAQVPHVPLGYARE